MNTIITVMKSLVALNGWEVERFDLHSMELRCQSYYSAYLYIKGIDKRILIRQDGSFEWYDEN